MTKSTAIPLLCGVIDEHRSLHWLFCGYKYCDNVKPNKTKPLKEDYENGYDFFKAMQQYMEDRDGSSGGN